MDEAEAMHEVHVEEARHQQPKHKLDGRSIDKVNKAQSVSWNGISAQKKRITITVINQPQNL